MALEHGIETPGTLGRATHLGDPLTCPQIRELPDGAEVVITWCGGNGPHPYRILVDTQGGRRAEGMHNDLILNMDGWDSIGGGLQLAPLHRVTLGWDDATREWAAQKIALPDHLLERQEILRGLPQPEWTDQQMLVADALEETGRLLADVPWRMLGHQVLVERELPGAVLKTVAKKVLGERWLVLMTSEQAGGHDDQTVIAQVLTDVDRRLLNMPYQLLGGVPLVDRDLVLAVADEVAAAVFGRYWGRAMRRASRMADR